LRFKDPDQLWSACLEYFEWVHRNPLFEAKAIALKGVVTIAQVPRIRAMTIEGLCLFLGINKKTWIEYRARERFRDIVERVDSLIRTQKFEGAAAGLLNGKIITRDLDLADKERAAREAQAYAGLSSHLDHLPLHKRVAVTGYCFVQAVMEAEAAGDKEAQEKALEWMEEADEVMKGEKQPPVDNDSTEFGDL
jgi:hypothetical protein